MHWWLRPWFNTCGNHNGNERDDNDDGRQSLWTCRIVACLTHANYHIWCMYLWFMLNQSPSPSSFMFTLMEPLLTLGSICCFCSMLLWRAAFHCGLQLFLLNHQQVSHHDLLTFFFNKTIIEVKNPKLGKIEVGARLWAKTPREFFDCMIYIYTVCYTVFWGGIVTCLRVLQLRPGLASCSVTPWWTQITIFVFQWPCKIFWL